MQNAEPIQLRQVRDFGQCITDTFLFLKQNIRMFRFSMVISVPILVVGSLLMNYVPMALLSSNTDLLASGALGFIFNSPISTLSYLIGFCLTIVGFVLLQASIHEYIRAYHLGEQYTITAKQILQRSIAEFWNYFGAGFFMPLVVFISIFLCILPVFYVGPILCLTITAHAIERTGGMASWGRSNSLVQGDFWPTLGLYLVTVLIWYVCLFILQAPLFLIGGGIGFATGIDMIQQEGPEALTGMMKMLNWFQIISSIVSSFVTVLTLPILSVCMCLKYFSRVEEKEGHGLQERLATFDQA